MGLVGKYKAGGAQGEVAESALKQRVAVQEREELPNTRPNGNTEKKGTGKMDQRTKGTGGGRMTEKQPREGYDWTWPPIANSLPGPLLDLRPVATRYQVEEGEDRLLPVKGQTYEEGSESSVSRLLLSSRSRLVALLLDVDGPLAVDRDGGTRRVLAESAPSAGEESPSAGSTGEDADCSFNRFCLCLRFERPGMSLRIPLEPGRPLSSRLERRLISEAIPSLLESPDMRCIRSEMPTLSLLAALSEVRLRCEISFLRP